MQLGAESWELDWDPERELGWDLGAEGTKSSEVVPGRLKMRILSPNGGPAKDLIVFSMQRP